MKMHTVWLVFLVAMVILAGVMSYVLYRERTANAASHTSPDVGDVLGISMEQSPEDRPKLQRVYTATVGVGTDRQCEITLKYRTYSVSGGRYKSGELTQQNGRWVLFDPEKVAEKILDRDLVPDIEAVVAKVEQMDAAFLESNPSRFTDETGVVWIKETR